MIYNNSQGGTGERDLDSFNGYLNRDFLLTSGRSSCYSDRTGLETFHNIINSIDFTKALVYGRIPRRGA